MELEEGETLASVCAASQQLSMFKGRAVQAVVAWIESLWAAAGGSRGTAGSDLLLL